MNNTKTIITMLEIYISQIRIYERNQNYFFNKSVRSWRRADLKNLKFQAKHITINKLKIRDILQKLGIAYIEHNDLEIILNSKSKRKKIFYG
jgi:hypothetical protein